MAHAFNPSTWEAEAGGFLSLRWAWSTKWVPGQPGLYRETLSRKNKQTNKQTKIFIYLFVYLFILCIWVHWSCARRGHQIPLQMAVSHHVVAGNWTRDLWKESQCSQPLSHLSSPAPPFLSNSSMVTPLDWKDDLGALLVKMRTDRKVFLSSWDT